MLLLAALNLAGVKRLAPYLPAPPAAGEDRWMGTREAAEYLGISVEALHKLTASRSIPFTQDVVVSHPMALQEVERYSFMAPGQAV